MLASLSHADAIAREWVVTHRTSSLNLPLWVLSEMARGGLLFLACAAVLALIRRRISDLIAVVVAIAVASLLADHIFKPLVARERPFVSAPAIPVIGGKPDDASLPSGHAANASAAAITLSRIAPQATAIWWGVAILVAYSRVYLGVHYPGDVIAGAIAGVCSGIVALSIIKNAGRHKP